MPKIVFLITEDWFFTSHFLPMARTAKEAGLDVIVVTRVRDHGKRIRDEGFRIVPIEIERGSFSVTSAIRDLRLMYRIVRSENPDIVHCIALRMVVLGGLVAKWGRVKAIILAPTGLGHLWNSTGFGARLLRGVVQVVVGGYLNGPDTYFLFENREDPLSFGLESKDPNVTIVSGAGVNPGEFPVTPEPPSPPVRIAVVARMLKSKGIEEAVDATLRARRLGAPVELDIYGQPDPHNPMSISDKKLRQWSQQPGISWHGYTDDIAAVWRDHHAAIFLTSYREGMPRTLVEAAASGRPIITTDIAGCRELVRDRIEGLVVPCGDVEAAAQAIVALATDANLRLRLGAAAHRRFEQGFTEEAVRRVVGEVYGRILRRLPPESRSGKD